MSCNCDRAATADTHTCRAVLPGAFPAWPGDPGIPRGAVGPPGPGPLPVGRGDTSGSGDPRTVTGYPGSTLCYWSTYPAFVIAQASGVTSSAPRGLCPGNVRIRAKQTVLTTRVLDSRQSYHLQTIMPLKYKRIPAGDH